MKTSNGKQLAKKMLIAMICGLACGFGCIMLREHLISSGQTDLWTKINKLFFQDITQPTATKAVGIFYIVGQLSPNLNRYCNVIYSLSGINLPNFIKVFNLTCFMTI